MASMEPYGLRAVSKPFQHIPLPAPPQPSRNGSCYCGPKDKYSRSFQAVVPYLNGLIALLSGVTSSSLEQKAESFTSPAVPRSKLGTSCSARCVAALSDLHFGSLASCFLNVSTKSLSVQHNSFFSML